MMAENVSQPLVFLNDDGSQPCGSSSNAQVLSLPRVQDDHAYAEDDRMNGYGDHDDEYTTDEDAEETDDDDIDCPERQGGEDHSIQDLITSKIAELETANSKESEDAPKTGRASKRQSKELRQLLDGNGAPEEKLRALHQRFLMQLQENRKLERELSSLKRKCEQVNKEKDTIYAELTKANAIKGKLEALCRELQKQNKIVIEDSKRVAADEQQKRQELSKKFHNTIKEITAKLEEQGEERMKQFRENELLRDKLKNFAEQYEIREQHFAHQLRTKDLEQQLLEAKFRQQLEIAAQETIKAQAYKEQVLTLTKTETELRNQLSLYGEKFEQFQDTLTKSNEVFTTFKREMEKMSKTIKKLEKENGSLKSKCEKSDVTIIEMLDERTNNRKQIDTLKSQKEKLEGLCRTLQTERQGNRDELDRLRNWCREKGMPIADKAPEESVDNGNESRDAAAAAPQICS